MTATDGRRTATPHDAGGTSHGRRVLGVWSLSLISPAATLTLPGMRSVAEYGWSSIAHYALGATLLFVPVSFAVPELASGSEKIKKPSWVIANPDEVSVDAEPQTDASAPAVANATADVLGAGSPSTQSAAD